MKKCLFLCVLIFAFLSAGCTYITVTGQLTRINNSSSAMQTKYPYKFYVSSMLCNFQMKDFLGIGPEKQYISSEYDEFSVSMRTKLAQNYPDLFVKDKTESSIPISYTIDYNNNISFLSSLLATPFNLLNSITLGLCPSMMDNESCDVSVQVNFESETHSYQQNTKNRNRYNLGFFGVFDTRKILPDLSKSDVAPVEIVAFSSSILEMNMSSECSSDFLNLFVYALMGLDHKKIHLIYNQQYHPNVDFMQE